MKLRTGSQITYYAFTEIRFSLPVKIKEFPSAKRECNSIPSTVVCRKGYWCRGKGNQKNTMLRHVEWQMKNIPGGLGDKMEDWVERLHQWGMQQRRRFRTVQNPLVRAMAREKASSRNTHPDVLAQVEATDEGNKRKLSEKNEIDILSIKRKLQREEGRIKALEYFEEFSKEEKQTWVEIIFDDVKEGGGEKNGISPSIPKKPSAAGVADNV